MGNTLLGLFLGGIAGLLSWTSVMIFCCYNIGQLLLIDPQSVLALAAGFSLGYTVGLWMVNHFFSNTLDFLRALQLYWFTYFASVTFGRALINVHLDTDLLLMLFIVSLFFHINRMVKSLNPE